MKINNLIITALLAVMATSAFSQTRLTREECRQKALENNSAIAIGREKVRSSQYTRREAFTKYFPEVAGGAMMFHTSKDVFKLGFLDNIVTVQFLDKGRSAAIGAVQPIFMGGQIVNGNKLAKVGEDASKIELEQTHDQVVNTVDQYFWNIVKLQSKRGTLDAAMLFVDSLQKQVKVAYEAGLITVNDLLEVELKRNQLKADSIDLENGIALSKRLLGQYIGESVDEIDPSYDILIENAPLIPEEIHRNSSQAVASTTQYRLLDKNVEAKRLETRMTTGKYLPSVALGAGYFYDHLLGENNGFMAVGVTVTVPLSGWWGGSYDIKRSKSERLQAELERENYGELIEIGIDNAWDELTSAQRKASLAHESIGSARENLRINKAFYDAGTTQITDLLQAEALYRGSQDSFIDAYAQYQICLTAYQTATSQLDDI